MDNSKILIYDGSFNGFLTAVFVGFDENIEVMGFQKIHSSQKGLFSDAQTIYTQISKAKRVWDSIEKKNSRAIKNIYFAFLSETDGIDFMLYKYIRRLFSAMNPVYIEEYNALEMKISQLAKNVGREKQRIERLLEFKSTEDNIYMAEIETTYNILPIISRHFRNKYPKNQWIIFDRKRNYGMYYNLVSVEIISPETKALYLGQNFKNNNYVNNNYRCAV